MATIKISALPSAVSIDGVNDVLPIVQSGTTNKISRNTLLGITGAPLGTTDTQTVSSKTIDNTNAITVKDNSFTLQDDGDTTKRVQFQLSGITTGNTRTLTVPNASVTLASLTGTETFTNKTITSPTITGGTIANATITVDSIAGFSTGTIVTVANLQISNGVLNSANAVTSTSIAAGAVQPQALVAGTGTGWSWQSWSPTLTNLTLGNGTVSANYIQMGKTVYFRVRFTLGTTSAVGTAPTFSVPVTPNSFYNAADLLIGLGLAVVGSTEVELGVGLNATAIRPLLVGAAAAQWGPTQTITASAPGVWASTNFMTIQGTYEAQ